MKIQKFKRSEVKKQQGVGIKSQHYLKIGFYSIF